MISISVLGPLEVRRDGQLIAIPAGKTSELFVRLALDAGSAVRTDRLVDDLWGDDSVRTSRNTVQSKIAKLRRALGNPPVVIGGDGGYTLTVDPLDVDAVAVSTRIFEAAALLGHGDHQGAAELCAATLRMCRGDLLAAAGDGQWATPHRFDVLPLLVATDGVVGRCGRDVRRLRPNILIGGVAGMAEVDWPGAQLAIGDAVIDLHSLRQRCPMTTVDPDTLERDRTVLVGINHRFGGRLALNAEVSTPGTIYVGDTVTISWPQPFTRAEAMT